MSTSRTGAEFSSLTLGTVQFGLPYGIANRSGQPDRDLVKSILKVAYDGGIRVLDTAAAYGESEQVLGDALRESGIDCGFQICTKIRPLTQEERNDPVRCQMAIQSSLENSLKKLRVESLEFVLFHRDADVEALDILREYQRRGWVERVGVSASNSEIDIPAWASMPAVKPDVVQVPGSPVDLRYVADPGLCRFSADAGTIFVRSIYLQGLLLMEEPQIPAHLRGILPACRFLKETANAAGMNTNELCLRFVLGLPEVSSIVVGMETLEQLKDNLGYWSRGPLPFELIDLIRTRIPSVSPELLIPSRWDSMRKTV